jgi:hypothetical protein
LKGVIAALAAVALLQLPALRIASAAPQVAVSSVGLYSGLNYTYGSCTATGAAATQFTTTVKFIYVQVNYSNWQGSHAESKKWYDPSHALYEQDPPYTYSDSGATRSCSYFAVAGTEAVNHLGSWQLEVYVDGQLLSMVSFSLVRAVATTPTPTPLPVETPTPVPQPSLSITSLKTFDNGNASQALYYKNRTLFYLHYRLDNAAPSGKAVAIFQVSGSVGTLIKYTQPLKPRAEGDVRVEMGGALTTGRRVLEAWVWIGQFHAYASTTFVVFDPPGYKTWPSSQTVEAYHICCARVEGNAQAQRDPYTLHFDPVSFRDEGRQTGYYEAMQLGWPSISKKVATVRSDLVSIYGSVQQATDAFNAQLAGYLWAAAGNCGWCAPHIQAIDTSGWSFGDCCRAAYYTSDGTVDTEETFFVRGQVLIQVWSFWADNDPSAITQHVARASAACASTLDYIAWRQQQS